MKKYYSELLEAMHEDVLADFRKGRITEAELREFEADAFIDDESQEEKPLVMEEERA